MADAVGEAHDNYRLLEKRQAATYREVGAPRAEVVAVLHEVAGALHTEVAVLHVGVEHLVAAAAAVNSNIQELDMKLHHNHQASTEWDFGMEVGVVELLFESRLAADVRIQCCSLHYLNLTPDTVMAVQTVVHNVAEEQTVGCHCLADSHQTAVVVVVHRRCFEMKRA